VDSAAGLATADMSSLSGFCVWQKKRPPRKMARTVSEKLPKIPLFWTFFNSSDMAYWISATSAKLSPFNFIFNLGNRK
jgi:hypothetical protein